MSAEKAIASAPADSSSTQFRDTSARVNSPTPPHLPLGREPSFARRGLSPRPRSNSAAVSPVIAATEDHYDPFIQYACDVIKARQVPHGANPAFEIVSGYTKIIFTPRRTRVSVAPVHRRHRTALIVAALMIRSDLEDQHGKIESRLEGEPKIRLDGTIRLTLLSRRYRPRHTVVVTPTQLADQLREWITT